MTFPKQMRWDAYLEDGKGRSAVRPPDSLARAAVRRPRRAVRHPPDRAGAGPDRPGRPVGSQYLRPSLPDDQRPRGPRDQGQDVRRLPGAAARELRHPRSRRARISGSVASSRRTRASSAARVSGLVASQSSLLQEVPDLVEYPSVVAGHIPGRVPPASRGSADDDDDPPPALLPGGGRRGAAEAGVPGRHQHAGGAAGDHRAQLGARADGAAARRALLLGRGPQGDARSRASSGSSTILFHKKLGSYREKADRVAALAAWIARRSLRPAATPRHAPSSAGRLCKADLATDMVRELTELQGTMGGIYAREEGQPEEVWKAIYYHYLPVGVEADAPPSRQQLGAAAVDVGGGVARRQARFGRRDVLRRASGRPARAIRSACGVRRRAR